MRALIKLHPRLEQDFLGLSVLPQMDLAGIQYEVLPIDLPSDCGELNRHGDFVIVFGGDGTFLTGAMVAHCLNIPVTGVEVGHLGFLCQQPLERLPELLKAIRDGSCRTELRRILACELPDIKGNWEEHTAVNDVVVGITDMTRLAPVSVLIDGEMLATFRGDGIVVSSATGCTAYSLAAGGPLMEPTSPDMVITPICAHTLFAKPFVVSGSRTIELRVECSEPEIFVSMDGRKVKRLEPGSSAKVSLHPQPLKVARMDTPTHFQVLREKFGWGFEFKRGGSKN
jgi:NAD+ kinase